MKDKHVTQGACGSRMTICQTYREIGTESHVSEAD